MSSNNIKIAESLATAVSALTPDDHQIFQSTLIKRIIQKTTGICGGHARVRNTRIAVWTLISLAQQGMDDDTILQDFPGLTHLDLWITRMYYRDHHDEIDTLIIAHHREDGWDV
ncbi:MAG: DUF433 domain-containing protein [Cyanobacteria bacterium P01_F01_bin.150]